MSGEFSRTAELCQKRASYEDRCERTTHVTVQSEMTSGVSPVKVDVETDALISHTAHFLERSKKDVVDAAVREYIENHRDEINAGVRAALAQLDGTKGSVVSMLTGFDAAKLAELGGIGE